jgi:hypothetical protein
MSDVLDEAEVIHDWNVHGDTPVPPVRRRLSEVTSCEQPCVHHHAKRQVAGDGQSQSHQRVRWANAEHDIM